MKNAGLLPVNGPAGRRACCPPVALTREMNGAALNQPRRAPAYCKDTSEPQIGHPPRTNLRARQVPPVPPALTAEPHGSDPRRARRNRAKRRWSRTTAPIAPNPKLPPSQATPVTQTGDKQGGTRLPSAVPYRVPCAPSRSPAWDTPLCRCLWVSPTCPPLLPQTQWGSNAHDSQLENDSTGISPHSKTTPNNTENQTTSCQHPSFLRRTVVYNQAPPPPQRLGKMDL
ncbi:rho GTPase-activating protein 17-like [Corapipo altera]|uniref:rho GTPase-activating protein 17-like n=1 Tax=Corapipo altera TaxID=415028 RepID=UPI000FD6A6C2|nr:rho GTPase-activating protein 17-like [Corapipo altera]